MAVDLGSASVASWLRGRRQDAVLGRAGGGRRRTGGRAAVAFAQGMAAMPRSSTSQDHLPPTLLRLSVGIEDVDDLWRVLDEALREGPLG